MCVYKCEIFRLDIVFVNKTCRQKIYSSSLGRILVGNLFWLNLGLRNLVIQNGSLFWLNLGLRDFGNTTILGEFSS